MDGTQNCMEKIPLPSTNRFVRRTVTQLHVEQLPSADRLRGHHFIAGFAGQRIVKLPEDVIRAAARQPLTKSLLASSAGYYPKAAGHLARRPVGTDETIFIYCTAGSGWCDMLGKHYKIKAGELLVLPANTVHSYGAEEKYPWSIRWFHAVGSQIPDFLETLGVTSEQPVVALGEDAMLDSLFEEVLTELETGYTALNLIYAAQTAAHLLAAMIRRRHNHWTDAPDARQRVARSIELMRNHLDRPLKMVHLAGICGFSPPHFTSLFRAQTGFAPKDYFTRLKMHHASQLLNGTNLSVKEIASRLGYDDPLHFSRVFKQLNALSPTDHRRENSPEPRKRESAAFEITALPLGGPEEA